MNVYLKFRIQNPGICYAEGNECFNEGVYNQGFLILLKWKWAYYITEAWDISLSLPFSTEVKSRKDKVKEPPEW